MEEVVGSDTSDTCLWKSLYKNNTHPERSQLNKPAVCDKVEIIGTNPQDPSSQAYCVLQIIPSSSLCILTNLHHTGNHLQRPEHFYDPRPLSYTPSSELPS
ncbi:hypothetical protein M8J75_010413 [Diaphorina citri]|nr:hypothetical protein M8J75_010413 [Diaphorina citri]